MKDELLEIRDKYGDERKTEIQEVEDEIDIEDLIEEEQCVFTLTRNGYIKRTSASEYTAQSKGGMGKRASPPATRTRWSTCSPPRPTTISSSLRTPARCTARRAIRSPRAARPPRGTQHRQHHPGGDGRARAGDDPLPRLECRKSVPHHGDAQRHGEASAGRDAQEPAQQRHPRAEPRRGRRAGERARDGRRAEDSDRHARRHGGRL